MNSLLFIPTDPEKQYATNSLILIHTSRGKTLKTNKQTNQKLSIGMLACCPLVRAALPKGIGVPGYPGVFCPCQGSPLRTEPNRCTDWQPCSHLALADGWLTRIEKRRCHLPQDTEEEPCIIVMDGVVPGGGWADWGEDPDWSVSMDNTTLIVSLGKPIKSFWNSISFSSNI